MTRFWCAIIWLKLWWFMLNWRDPFSFFCDITYGYSLIVRFLKNQKPRLRFDLFGLNENHKSYHNLPLWNHSNHANKRCCLYLFTRIRQTSYFKAESRLSQPKTVGGSTEHPRKVWTSINKIEVTFDWMALSEILFRMKSNLQKTDNQNDLVPRFRSKSLYRRTSKIELK